LNILTEAHAIPIHCSGGDGSWAISIFGTSSHELNIDAIPDGAQRHALTQGEQTIVGIKVLNLFTRFIMDYHL